MAKSKFDAGRQVGGRVPRTVQMVVIIAAVGFGLYARMKGAGPDGIRLVTVVALSIFAVVAIVMTVARYIWLSDLKKVQRANPDAVVFPAAMSDSFKRALKGPAAAERTTLGSFPNVFSVVADARGIGFWGGGAEPQLKYFIHWVDVVVVAPTETMVSVNQQTGLAIDTRFGDAVIPIEIVVTRRPHGFFRRAEFETLQRLAADIEAKRPVPAVA